MAKTESTTGARQTKSQRISPRARRLAEQYGIDISTLTGTGPNGRIVESDIPIPEGETTRDNGSAQGKESAPGSDSDKQSSDGQAAAVDQTRATRRAARDAQRTTREERTAARDAQRTTRPERNTARDAQRTTRPERSTARDAQRTTREERTAARDAQRTTREERTTARDSQRTTRPERRSSVATRRKTTDSITLHRTADARALRRLETRLGVEAGAAGESELPSISVDALVLFAVAQTLPAFPTLAQKTTKSKAAETPAVHLEIVIDTADGPIAPVIANVDQLGLHELAETLAGLKGAAGAVIPNADTPGGAAFQVIDLSHVGIESFTPGLDSTRNAILGVGAILPRTVESAGATGKDGQFEYAPHLSLSLTLASQLGAEPTAALVLGARFLQALADRLAKLDEDPAFLGAVGSDS